MSKACRVDGVKEMVGWEVGRVVGGLVDSFAHAVVWFQWGRDSPVLLLQAASLLFQSFFFFFFYVFVSAVVGSSQSINEECLYGLKEKRTLMEFKNNNNKKIIAQVLFHVIIQLVFGAEFFKFNLKICI